MRGPNLALLPPKIDRPRVLLTGQYDRPEFSETVDLLRASASVSIVPDRAQELIVVAQTVPNAISVATIRTLQHEAPLAGVVALMGSWCEGETRTGRPWPAVERLYWYQFSRWWMRQLQLRAAGRCPDWARPGLAPPPQPVAQRRCGLVIVDTPARDTASALADVLQLAGYAVAWQPRARRGSLCRGALAGFWDGAQLDAVEERHLASFCAKLRRGRAPVIVMLDFPRRDSCERARAIGAAAILGKPCSNTDILMTVEHAISRREVGTNVFYRAA